MSQIPIAEKSVGLADYLGFMVTAYYPLIVEGVGLTPQNVMGGKSLIFPPDVQRGAYSSYGGLAEEGIRVGKQPLSIPNGPDSTRSTYHILITFEPDADELPERFLSASKGDSQGMPKGMPLSAGVFIWEITDTQVDGTISQLGATYSSNVSTNEPSFPLWPAVVNWRGSAIITVQPDSAWDASTITSKTGQLRQQLQRLFIPSLYTGVTFKPELEAAAPTKYTIQQGVTQTNALQVFLPVNLAQVVMSSSLVLNTTNTINAPVSVRVGDNLRLQTNIQKQVGGLLEPAAIVPGQEMYLGFVLQTQAEVIPQDFTLLDDQIWIRISLVRGQTDSPLVLSAVANAGVTLNTPGAWSIPDAIAGLSDTDIKLTFTVQGTTLTVVARIAGVDYPLGDVTHDAIATATYLSSVIVRKYPAVYAALTMSPPVISQERSVDFITGVIGGVESFGFGEDFYAGTEHNLPYFLSGETDRAVPVPLPPYIAGRTQQDFVLSKSVAVTTGDFSIIFNLYYVANFATGGATWGAGVPLEDWNGITPASRDGFVLWRLKPPTGDKGFALILKSQGDLELHMSFSGVGATDDLYVIPLPKGVLPVGLFNPVMITRDSSGLVEVFISGVKVASQSVGSFDLALNTDNTARFTRWSWEQDPGNTRQIVLSASLELAVFNRLLTPNEIQRISMGMGGAIVRANQYPGVYVSHNTATAWLLRQDSWEVLVIQPVVNGEFTLTVDFTGDYMVLLFDDTEDLGASQNFSHVASADLPVSQEPVVPTTIAGGAYTIAGTAPGSPATAVARVYRQSDGVLRLKDTLTAGAFSFQLDSTEKLIMVVSSASGDTVTPNLVPA